MNFIHLRFILFILLIVVVSCKDDGLNTKYYINGQKKSEGQVINGKKNGEWKYWYENGVLFRKEIYNNGIEDGLSVSFYENGQIMDSAIYKMGKHIDTLKCWHLSGSMNTYVIYNGEGVMHGATKIWDENGVVRQEGSFKNGQMDGRWQDFFDNGSIKKLHYYKEGNEIGRSIYFKENGDTLKIEEYTPTQRSEK